MLVPGRYIRRGGGSERVEAAQVTDQAAELVAGWCSGRVDRSGGGVLLFTPDSVIAARVGDYIVRRPDGRCFPVKRATFELAYTPA